ncbi:MAG: rRNA maturation RNase YbeY [Alphaproteobacteria bacterium]|nr:rRNA maturation RNase YbeY [Alphaproteobacteria bacterium]
MNIALDLEIEDKRWQQVLPDIENAAQRVQKAVFEYLSQNEDLPFLTADKPVSVNLCLSDDAHVRQLNRDFRQMDKPTNVLSFANIDFDSFEGTADLFGEIALGDIIIAYETMQKEADEMQISLYDHFCHLFTHGLLHLSGYDHIEAEDAAYMENLEKNILQTLGIANPYADEE